jgi:very-short-patch-repair endonuclease
MWLKNKGIKFDSQHTFPNLLGNGEKFKRHLPVDFFLPELNMVIEFDGQQHFEPVCFNVISKKTSLSCFEKIQKTDLLKNDYFKQNGISLLRISYKQIKAIPEILESIFNKGAHNVQ